MIISRDFSSLSTNKNLKGNAQGNPPQLKRSYTNQSDAFQSNKAADPSFGKLIKRTFIENVLRGGDSFDEFSRKWSVERAFDLAKKTEKMVPSLKKTAKQLEKEAQKALKKSNLTPEEALKITEAAPNSIKEAKATSVELKMKSKKSAPKPKSAEDEAEEAAKEIILTKKDKKRLSKAIADQLGINADKETLKVIRAVIDAKIIRAEAESAQKAVPILKADAKKLKEAVEEEIAREIMEERSLRKARAAKTSNTFNNIKKAIANFFPTKKKA